jgi:leukocyte immunoglobulin-like receptor
VTIWCEGTLEAQEYHLNKEEAPETWIRHTPLQSKKKAKLFISSMTEQDAG